MLMADYLNIADVTIAVHAMLAHTHRMGQYTHARTITRLMMSNNRGKRLQLAYRKQTQDTPHHNQSTARILKTDYKE